MVQVVDFNTHRNTSSVPHLVRNLPENFNGTTKVVDLSTVAYGDGLEYSIKSITPNSMFYNVVWIWLLSALAPGLFKSCFVPFLGAPSYWPRKKNLVIK